jgi:hypothetical protein
MYHDCRHQVNPREGFTSDDLKSLSEVFTSDCLGFGLDAAALGLNFVPGGIATKTLAQQTVGSALFGAGLGINGSQGDVAGIGLDGMGAITSNVTSISKAFFAGSGVAALYSAGSCIDSLVD